MEKKLIVGLSLACLAQIQASIFFRFYLTRCQTFLQAIIAWDFTKTNELQKMTKETNLGPDFGSQPQIGLQKFCLWVLPLLDVRYCCKLLSYAISQKLKNQLDKIVKKLILGTIFACLVQTWATKFFCGYYFYYMLDIVASYHCM